MNLTPRLKKWIAWLIVAALIGGLNIYLGVSYPVPPPPPVEVLDPLGITHHDALAVTNDTTIGGDLTVSGTASWGCDETTINDNLTITGTLTAQTGVITDTLDVSGITTLNSSLDVDGNISSGTGAITYTDNLMIDGAANVVQLTVQGYTTQTGSLLVVENSAGTDKLNVDASGNITVAGTLTLESATFSGPLKFGTDASTTDGEQIAHGFATTPTIVLATPISTAIGGDLFLAVHTITATLFTVDVMPAAASGEIGIYWIAGK